MESTNVLAVLALLAAAVVVVILLLRFMRGRRNPEPRALPRPSSAPASPNPQEEEYLDSSHIGGPVMPTGDPSRSDAAARAVAALRNSKLK